MDEEEIKFWNSEIEKINNPVSGAYYFYCNYVQLEGGKKEVISEEEFYRAIELSRNLIPKRRR